MSKKKISPFYKPVKWLVRKIYPKMQVLGAEHLPDEPVIIVGNHSQIHGPIVCELYMPRERYTWCAGEMLHLKEVPAYAFQDFWSGKPKCTHWFYKLLSYLIAPLSVFVFGNANTIGVFRGAAMVNTFRTTVNTLAEGTDVVIFPEHYTKHNHIVYDFQDRFIDIARLYYKKTGKELSFVPLYIAPKLKQMHLGAPIRFDASVPLDGERRRICDYLMDEITSIACSLPPHTVVPYPNVPKKQYPCNIQKEVDPNEKARC